MGCGKSVLGKKFATRLNLDFVDLDNLLEERYKMTIPGIFSQFNEDIFRNLESEMLKTFLKKDNFVLSCGGGTPCFNNNMEIINSSGTSIYIKLNTKALVDRLSKSKKNRPLIKGLGPEQLLDKISNLLSKREYFYNQAQIIVSGIDIKPDDVIARLLKQ